MLVRAADLAVAFLIHPRVEWKPQNGLPWGKFTLPLGRTAQIRGSLWHAVVIPSEALCGDAQGTCRDCTGRSSRQETVQTPNPKGAAKVVVGKHNPLVPGSTPGGPTKHPEKPLEIQGVFLLASGTLAALSCWVRC